MTPGKVHLLIIAEPNSYRIAAYLAAANEMGIEVLIASAGQYSLISEVHDGLHINLEDKQAALKIILQQTRIKPFSGVLGVDDSTVELAAIVARELGLAHNNPSAAELTRRKDLARTHLASHGCAVPSHWLVNLGRPLGQQMAEIAFPCVLKPLAMSASRGVIRANNTQEFISACQRIEQILANEQDGFEKTHLLVEQYIGGEEVAYEGFLRNGKLETLVIFDKPDPLTGPFFEETIYVTPSSLSCKVQTSIKKQVAMACNAYGLSNGPVHAELRIDDTDAWILEVAARTIGGDCARSLDNGSEFNLEAMVISLAIGRDYNIAPPRDARGVMMIPIKKRGILMRIEGLEKAKKVKHIENINMHIRAGNELIPLPEGNQYPGFIFARAETVDDVVLALRAAYQHLEFIVAPILTTRLAKN